MLTRREILAGSAPIGGAAVAQGDAKGGGKAAVGDAFLGKHAVKPLPFDPKKLPGLSEKLLVSHHDNNYAGAARRVGQIQQMLAGLPNNAPGFQVKGLKMEELIATN